MNANMNAIVHAWLTPAILFCAVGPSRGGNKTELAKLAATMKPGTWAELKTADYNLELLKVQNHHILEYTDTAVWDPKSQQVLFVGQGHYSAVKFIRRAQISNATT